MGVLCELQSEAKKGKSYSGEDEDYDDAFASDDDDDYD